MDEGTLVMSGLKRKDVLDAVRVVMRQRSDSARVFRPVLDYEADNVSKKVVRLIFSYTDYVNRTVWRKPG
jgi:UDP-N-acetylglucosamine 2-epimerase (non-hydrolysing)